MQYFNQLFQARIFNLCLSAKRNLILLLFGIREAIRAVADWILKNSFQIPFKRDSSSIIHFRRGSSSKIHFGRGSSSIIHIGRGSSSKIHFRRGSSSIIHLRRGSYSKIHFRRGSSSIIHFGRGSSSIIHLRRGSFSIIHFRRSSSSIIHFCDTVTLGLFVMNVTLEPDVTDHIFPFSQTFHPFSPSFYFPSPPPP